MSADAKCLADQQQRRKDIEIAALKVQTHSQTLSKENAETAEMHAQISSLTTHRDELAQQREELRAEMASLQSTLTARREAQAKQVRYLHSQSRWNGPELHFWEEYLCMHIEGAGQADRLKFTFNHICEREWEKEAWFELDTSEREYRVRKTNPKIEKDEVDAVVDRLNESRDLGPFFKGMREIFVKHYK